jgi:GNAT superfamily N-acetyltransferase
MEPDTEHTNWVFESDNLKQFNEEGECVCGNNLSDLDALSERFGGTTAVKTVWCEECERKYYISESFDDEAVPLTFALSTEAEPGLHEVRWEDEEQPWDLQYATLSLFSFMPRISQYLDLFPFNYDSVWAYVDEERHVISALVEQSDGIQVVGTAPGFQRKGYGTKIVEKWAQKKDDETIKVHGWFDDVEEFYRKLNYPVQDTTAED